MRTRSARTTLRLAAVITLLLLAACDRTGLQISDRIAPDGVREIITTAEEPLPVPWILTPELTIGVTYGDEAYMLGDISMLTVMPGGEIVALDNRPLQFRVFDADGTALATFGEEGSGPDGLARGWRSGACLRSAPDGGLEYFSRWPFRRQVWDLAGRLLSVETLPDTHPLAERRRGRWIQMAGERIFTCYLHVGRGDDDPAGEHQVWVSDWSGPEARQLFGWPGFDWTTLGEIQTGVGMAQAVSDHTPREQLLLTSTGRIYVTRLDEDWVRAYDAATGEELLRFRLFHERPIALTDALVEEARAQFGDQIGDGFAWWRDNLWQTYLAEGPDGEIWVQRNGNATDKGSWITDVFEAGGRYRGRLELPFPPIDTYLHGDHLVTIQPGAEGEDTIVRYRMERTAGGP